MWTVCLFISVLIYYNRSRVYKSIRMDVLSWLNYKHVYYVCVAGRVRLLRFRRKTLPSRRTFDGRLPGDRHVLKSPSSGRKYRAPLLSPQTCIEPLSACGISRNEKKLTANRWNGRGDLVLEFKTKNGLFINRSRSKRCNALSRLYDFIRADGGDHSIAKLIKIILEFINIYNSVTHKSNTNPTCA